MGNLLEDFSKRSTKEKTVVVVCVGCLGLFVLFALFGFLVGGDSDTTTTAVPTTTTNDDALFVYYAIDASDETGGLLIKLGECVGDYDVDGIIIYSAGLIVSSDTYKEKIEPLSVSSDYQSSKYYLIKYLDDLNSGAWKYGLAAEEMNKGNINTATVLLNSTVTPLLSTICQLFIDRSPSVLHYRTPPILQ